MILVPENIEEIKNFIQLELLKRGFTAPIKEFYEKENRLYFKTENFQTSPVLFENIRIENFSTHISAPFQHETGVQVRKVFICVHTFYNHFDGGTNTCNIFNFSCIIHKGNVIGMHVLY